MLYTPESLYTLNDLAFMLGVSEERLKKILHVMRLFRPDSCGWVPYKNVPAELESGLRRRRYSRPCQYGSQYTYPLEALITTRGVRYIVDELEKQFSPMLDNIEAVKRGEL